MRAACRWPSNHQLSWRLIVITHLPLWTASLCSSYLNHTATRIVVWVTFSVVDLRATTKLFWGWILSDIPVL